MVKSTKNQLMTKQQLQGQAGRVFLQLLQHHVQKQQHLVGLQPFQASNSQDRPQQMLTEKAGPGVSVCISHAYTHLAQPAQQARGLQLLPECVMAQSAYAPDVIGSSAYYAQ